MACIIGISSNNNEKDVKNVVDHNDSCWRSNGAKNPTIFLEINGYAKYLCIKFHKGFHASSIYLKQFDKRFKFSTDEYDVKIDVSRVLNLLDIVFETSFDPYNRFCVYSISFEV